VSFSEFVDSNNDNKNTPAENLAAAVALAPDATPAEQSAMARDVEQAVKTNPQDIDSDPTCPTEVFADNEASVTQAACLVATDGNQAECKTSTGTITQQQLVENQAQISRMRKIMDRFRAISTTREGRHEIFAKIRELKCAVPPSRHLLPP